MNAEKLNVKQLAKIQAEAEADRQRLVDQIATLPRGKAKALATGQLKNREAIIKQCQELIAKIRNAALVFLLVLAASCGKEDTCLGPGQVGVRAPGIVTWTNPVRVQIEVQGISWPGHAIMTPNDTLEYRIEGHANIRVRTECSAWSEWHEINKP